MSQQPVHVHFPDHLYERIRRAALESDRSPEAIVIESMSLLFDESIPEMQPSLLDQYTDRQLWAIIHMRLDPAEDAEMVGLIETSKRGDLSPVDQDRLDVMLAHLRHLTLLRSKSLRLLKQRGHNVEAYLELER